jgi:signal transduction histidine kinase
MPREQRSPRIASIDLRSWSAHRPVIVDVTIATAVSAAALVFEANDFGDGGSTLDAADFAICAIAFGLIVFRRRAPLPVLSAALIAAVWSLASGGHDVLVVATYLTLYTVASTSNRRTAWTAGAVVAGALFVTATISTPAPWYDGEGLELIAWTIVATAIGDAVRSRRAYVTAMQERATAMQERAERAEQVLDEETRRHVVEERLRIARELHDVVAHHIAVINVQAGVATHLLRDDPAGAEDALAHVRRGASNVLDELSSILNVMRQTDDPTTQTDPLPTLDQLDRLIDDFEGLGLEVEWHTSGARQRVAPAAALAAYRIVQESLTNAHRHGRTPRVCLRVNYQPDALTLEVLNDAATDCPTTHRGHGIIGMRERVAAAGGTIDVGPTTDGRFRVSVILPVTGDDR